MKNPSSIKFEEDFTNFVFNNSCKFKVAGNNNGNIKTTLFILLIPYVFTKNFEARLKSLRLFDFPKPNKIH